MKKLLFSAFVLLLSALCFSQTPIKTNVEFGNGKGAHFGVVDTYLGNDENNMYFITIESVSFSDIPPKNIVKVSKDLVVQEKYYFKKKNKGKINGLVHAYMADSIYCFISSYDSKKKTNSLILQAFDINTWEFSPYSKTLIEINTEKGGRGNKGHYSFEYSQDSSKMAIYFTPPESKDYKSFGFYVFDNNMNEIWNNEYTLPYLEKNYDPVEIEVSNKGDIFLMGYNFEEEQDVDNVIKGKKTYRYSIFKFSENGTQKDEYELNNDEYFLGDMFISIADNEDLFCSGFYSTHREHSPSGSYMMVVDGNSGEIKTQKYTAFSHDLYRQMLHPKLIKIFEKKVKNEEVLRYDDLLIKEIIKKDDGGVILIGEVEYVRRKMKGTKITKLYNYGDIVVVSFDKEGNVIWERKLPKAQETVVQNRSYASFSTLVYKDNVIFFYNDVDDNLNFDGTKTLKNPFDAFMSNIALFMVTIDKDGNIAKDIIVTKKEFKLYTIPTVTHQITEDEAIIIGLKMYDYYIGKVTFSE